MKWTNYYIFGLYWPMLVPVTGSFTTSQIIFALVFGIIGLHGQFNDGVYLPTKVAQIMLVAIIAAGIIFFTGVFAGGSVGRSLSDGVRLIFFAIYVVSGYQYARSEHYSERTLIKIITLYITVSTLFSLLVYVEHIHPLLDLFKGRLSDDEIPFHYYRLSGFSGFPTDFGALLVLGICLILADKNNSQYTPFYKLLFGLVCIFGLLGTVSRGAVLHLLAVVIFFLLYEIFRFFLRTTISKSTLKLIFTCSLITAGLVISFYGDFYTSEVFKYINVDLDAPDESVGHRFLEVEGAFDVLFKEGFLFGQERITPFGLPVIEGFWTHWVLRYSWFGLLIGMFLFIYLTRAAFGTVSVIGSALGLWFLGFFLAEGVFSDVLFRFKGPLVYGFLAGVCIRLYSVKKGAPIKGCINLSGLGKKHESHQTS